MSPYPLPLEPPSHPPYPTPLGHRKALSRSPCAMLLLPTSQLFYIRYCIYVNATLTSSPLSPPVAFFNFLVSPPSGQCCQISYPSPQDRNSKNLGAPLLARCTPHLPTLPPSELWRPSASLFTQPRMQASQRQGRNCLALCSFPGLEECPAGNQVLSSC